MSDPGSSPGAAPLHELAQFFALTPDLIAIGGKGGHFEILSPNWEQVLGYSLAELIGRPFWEFLHPDDLVATRAELERVSPGAESVEFENRYRCRDGSYRWLRWNGRICPQTGRLYAIARDTTERKRLEQELAAARDAAVASSQLKSELLRALAEQFGEPLEHLASDAEYLLAAPMPLAQRQLAKAVHRTSVQLLSGLRELGEYLNLESGPPRPPAPAIDLPAWLRELADPFRARAEALGLGFTLDVGERLSEPAVIDLPRVQQVLAQLLTLALESTRDGSITLAADAGELRGRRALRLEVRDTGIGMPAERIAHLIAAPVASGDEREGGRFGLGLAIAKQLVDVMGGALDGRSTPGLGCTVEVLVPVGSAAMMGRAASGAGEREPNTREPTPAGGQPAVGDESDAPLAMVVDDNVVGRLQILRLLGEAGYRAVLAPNRGAALEMLERHRPAVVVIDLALEEPEGYPTVRELRARLRPNRPLALIGVTADSRPSTRTRSLEAGLDAVVTKPVELAGLSAALRQPNRSLKPAAALEADDRPVDLSRIIDAADGEPAFQRELIRLFLADMERHLGAMRAAFHDGDLAEIRRRAHSVKGAAGHLGAALIGEIAADLEGGSSIENLEPSCLGRLESEFERARSYLEAYFVALDPTQPM